MPEDRVHGRARSGPADWRGGAEVSASPCDDDLPLVMTGLSDRGAAQVRPAARPVSWWMTASGRVALSATRTEVA